VLSASGKAVLYILFVDGPADNGDWSGRFRQAGRRTGSGNGLSQPVWVEREQRRRGRTDSMPGGHEGRLWEVRRSRQRPHRLEARPYGGRPLFIAKDANARPLPINGALEFRFHPQGGVMLHARYG